MLPKGRGRKQCLHEPPRICSNFGRSAAVYPSPSTSKSTLFAGLPIFCNSSNAPGDGGRDRSTDSLFGSTTVFQTSFQDGLALSPRSFSDTSTTASGFGNRSDSENVRFPWSASSVVFHSPNTELNPREYSSLPLARSRTSNR